MKKFYRRPLRGQCLMSMLRHKMDFLNSSAILLLPVTNTQAEICHLKTCQMVKVLNRKNFASLQGHKKFAV
jgi:hypothetical protein